MNDSDLDIKSIRKKLGLTQVDFAKKIGVDTRTVQNWEYGRIIPSTKSELIHSLIKDDNSSINEQTNQINQNGANISGEHVTVSNSDVRCFLDAINNAQSISKKSQEQIDRLLGIIEKMQDK